MGRIENVESPKMLKFENVEVLKLAVHRKSWKQCDKFSLNFDKNSKFKF